MSEFIITYDLDSATNEQRLAFHQVIGECVILAERKLRTVWRALAPDQSAEELSESLKTRARMHSKLGHGFVRDTLRMIVVLADEGSAKPIVEYRTRLHETRPLNRTRPRRPQPRKVGD